MKACKVILVFLTVSIFCQLAKAQEYSHRDHSWRLGLGIASELNYDDEDPIAFTGTTFSGGYQIKALKGLFRLYPSIDISYMTKTYSEEIVQTLYFGSIALNAHQDFFRLRGFSFYIGMGAGMRANSQIAGPCFNAISCEKEKNITANDRFINLDFGYRLDSGQNRNAYDLGIRLSGGHEAISFLGLIFSIDLKRK